MDTKEKNRLLAAKYRKTEKYRRWRIKYKLNGIGYKNSLERQKTLEGKARLRIRGEKYRKTKKYRDTIKKYWRKNRKRLNEYLKKRYRENTKKYRAYTMVQQAINSGSLIRGKCEVCDKERAEAHHDDYSKPLDVRWLCTYHHSHFHRGI